MIWKVTKSLRRLLLGCSFLVLFASCSSPENLQIETGSMDSFVPGVPNFTFGTFVKYDNPFFPELFVAIQIEYNSLIFKKSENGKFESKIELSAWLYDSNRNTVQLGNLAQERIITVDSYEETKSKKSIKIRERLKIKSGTYELSIQLDDVFSKKSQTKTAKFLVEDVRKSALTVGGVQLFGKQENDTLMEPVLTYHIGQDVKNLEGIVQLVFTENRVPAQVKARLLVFKVDSLSARLPYYNQPNRGNLEYKGIDFSQTDTLNLAYTQKQDVLGTVTLKVQIPKLKVGNYRLSIESQAPDSSKKQFRARDFSIKHAAFPELKTYDDLLSPLIYIATSDEFEEIIKKQKEGKEKLAFVQFWAKVDENKQKATSILKLYYSRVEEANKLFSTYKEGWKTDRGMIYILFGNPIIVEKTIEGEHWIYRQNTEDPNDSFSFRRIRGQVDFFPFEHFILERNINQERMYLNAADDWRNGVW